MAMGLSLGMPRALQNMQASPIVSDSDAEILETLDAFEMHVSPLSSDSDAGLVEALDMLQQSVACSAGDYHIILSWAVVRSAFTVMLTEETLAGLFLYLNDYCRLSLCCRHLQQHGVFLGLYRHWYQELVEAHYERAIELAAQDDSEQTWASELCETCGLRPCDDVLGGMECMDCFYEHTD